MAITIDGNGIISGITAGGLPDNSVTSADIADAAITPAKLSQPLTLATSQASTSGTFIDFTGIPSWVKRITVMFNGVSTNGTSIVQIQVGSGSITTSGYSGGYSSIAGTTVAGANFSSGIAVQAKADALNASVGKIEICLLTGSTYVAAGSIYNATYGGYLTLTDSVIALGGTLDRVRITTVNGTDTFDAGSINILYE